MSIFLGGVHCSHFWVVKHLDPGKGPKGNSFHIAVDLILTPKPEGFYLWAVQ